MRRRRFRTLAKWVCTVAAASLALGWAVSERWYLSWADTVENRTSFLACRGCITLSRDNSGIVGDFDFFVKPVGWSVGRTDRLLIKASKGWWPEGSVNAFGRFVCVPIWVMLVMAGVPAWLLWRGELVCRRGVGVCRGCEYDRRGLVAGAKCPECGAAADGG